MSVLSREQLGHLRHWDNLSLRQPNDWSLMQGKGIRQEDFGGYRFQLSYMIYGLALAHRHRLPAAPGLFRPTMQRLIAQHTGQSLEQIEADSDRDRWFMPEQAKEYGIIDRVINRRGEI